PTLGLIDHLTNWYVRRSRRRFWRSRGESGEGDGDKLAAFATLYEVLTTFSEVLAPVLPFITEHIYQDLVARHHSDAPSSIHHRDFPTADGALIDRALETAMASVREVVRLGRNLRKREGHRVRQPLSRLTVITREPSVADAVTTHASLISDELNVKEVTVSSDETAFVNLSAKANYRKLGPVLGSRMTHAATAIAGLSGDQIEELLAGGSTELFGQQITLDEILVERTPVEGTIVETGPKFACALDTTITRELKLEGLAREIVSKVQNMRRQAGLQVSDRIQLTWQAADDDVAVALDQYRDYIISEVLASELIRSSEVDGSDVEIDGHTIRLDVVKA
ncbi:MAG: DUF5915 domain-containing protein, partial [Actinobacteria bacterium]|nr:DUF5915 domain-containing protein [Actinomycetota bacterium]